MNRLQILAGHPRSVTEWKSDIHAAEDLEDPDDSDQIHSLFCRLEIDFRDGDVAAAEVIRAQFE